MKKILTILAIILLASCSGRVTINPDVHPVTIKSAEGLYQSDRISKYVYSLHSDNFFSDNEILLYSDSVYNIGDTIHFVKR